MENRFNLIFESWIPVSGKGRVGLKQIFEDSTIDSLGGNPVEKIAVFKLLLAVAQDAVTPADDKEWTVLGLEGFRKKVLCYLKDNIDSFWLYGDKPFLQMNDIKAAKLKSFGDVQMYVATGNTTVLTQIQNEKKLDDAEKALTLLTLMGFAFGGKKTDNSIVLTEGYKGKSNDKGKPATGKAGPSLDFMGLQHSFFLSGNLCNSIYINSLYYADL